MRPLLLALAIPLTLIGAAPQWRRRDDPTCQRANLIDVAAGTRRMLDCTPLETQAFQCLSPNKRYNATFVLEDAAKQTFPYGDVKSIFLNNADAGDSPNGEVYQFWLGGGMYAFKLVGQTNCSIDSTNDNPFRAFNTYGISVYNSL